MGCKKENGDKGDMVQVGGNEAQGLLYTWIIRSRGWCLLRVQVGDKGVFRGTIEGIITAELQVQISRVQF